MSQQVVERRILKDAKLSLLSADKSSMRQLAGPFVSNTAALAAKLQPGDLYYSVTGDQARVCVVVAPLI